MAKSDSCVRAILATLFTVAVLLSAQPDVASGRHVGSVHRNNNRLMKADINRLLAKKAVSKIAKAGETGNCGRQHRCQNGECIDQAFVCDGDIDCTDRSDEATCPEGIRCSLGRTKCANVDRCIQESMICDGENDCGDGSDEQNCAAIKPFACNEGQFKCAERNVCLQPYWVCDGDTDCPDGSDEQNCKTAIVGCPATRFSCRSGLSCINQLFVCDGEDDCGDNSDEVGCPERTTKAAGSVAASGDRPAVCPVNTFRCSNSDWCNLPIGWVCDGIDDCGDGSDERNCRACDAGLFLCKTSSKCIRAFKVCDGNNDCGAGDDSDEQNCPNSPEQSRRSVMKSFWHKN